VARIYATGGEHEVAIATPAYQEPPGGLRSVALGLLVMPVPHEVRAAAERMRETEASALARS
jgi:hypothetical protein